MGHSESWQEGFDTGYEWFIENSGSALKQLGGFGIPNIEFVIIRPIGLRRNCGGPTERIKSAILCARSREARYHFSGHEEVG